VRISPVGFSKLASLRVHPVKPDYMHITRRAISPRKLSARAIKVGHQLGTMSRMNSSLLFRLRSTSAAVTQYAKFLGDDAGIFAFEEAQNVLVRADQLSISRKLAVDA
jgi:hypothetical protein